MLVEHVVSRNVPTARPEDDVISAARRLLECRCGLLPVVVGDGRGARMVGLLRYRDAFAATYGRADETPVAAAMSPAVCTCRASDSLGLAVRLLRRSGMEALPVLDGEGYLVGVLSFADLMWEAAR
jgi:CBS-domain-containing membrane protein